MDSTDQDLGESMLGEAASIRDAAMLLQRRHIKIALICDANGLLLGTVTDGDLRRSIVSGFSPEDRATKVMNPKPLVAGPNDHYWAIQARMREIFDGHTKAAHATYELNFETGHPMTVNNDELTARLVPTLERLVGKDQVRQAPPITGAEDFSYFAQLVPGFYFRLGAVPEGKVSGGHHTPTFYAADESVPIGMRLMASLALDYLEGGTR